MQSGHVESLTEGGETIRPNFDPWKRLARLSVIRPSFSSVNDIGLRFANFRPPWRAQRSADAVKR